jgi:hypothetical protein
LDRLVARLALIGWLALAMAGCAGPMTQVLTRAPKGQPLTAGTHIVLMEPDVQLFEMTAGGLLEPRADWTATAKENVDAALVSILEAKHATIVPYAAPTDPAAEHLHVQLTKLHERVANTILNDRLPVLRLVGKGAVFDWTLGDQAYALAGETGAEYALFVRFVDSYASTGRVTLIVIYSLLGSPLPGGTQDAVASLVELKTGDLVWFNHLVNTTGGDLRTPERARDAVQALLADLPF